ncbi:MAG: type II toxin-antitoxin system prevent-host-death family antitoxin [Planctomycetota bacterium]
MAHVAVGVRDLKARLSHYLRMVRQGRTIEITDRGQTVGRIVPAGKALADKVEDLVAAGLVAWSGKKLKSRPGVPRATRKRSVADLLVRDRE